jgi:hypothetical protein
MDGKLHFSNYRFDTSYLNVILKKEIFDHYNPNKLETQPNLHHEHLIDFVLMIRLL